MCYFDLSALRLLIIWAILGSLPLSGCSPLYRVSADLAKTLQTIDIEPIPDRFGHYLTTALIQTFHAGGKSVQPRYRLVVTYQESRQAPLISTVVGRSTAATQVIEAQYNLFDLSTHRLVFSGTVTSHATYNRLTNRYAIIVAAQDADLRNARILAEEIRLELSIKMGNMPFVGDQKPQAKDP